MTRHSNDELQAIIERLPTTRDEDWKYTDLARARDISTRWLAAGAVEASTDLDDTIAGITASIDAHWFVIANGKLLQTPSVDGVSAERVTEVEPADGALAELNAALLQSGLRLNVSAVLDKPLGILLVDGAEDAAVTQAWIDITVAPQAQAGIVEYHASEGNAEHYANTAVAVTLADNAALSHVRIQDRAPGHVQTGRTTVTAGRDARYVAAAFDLGGGLIRNDLHIDIAAAGADVAFDGLYLAGDGQHIDNHTRVDHRVGPATSRQEYRGILNGKCRCVWNGKAIVHEGADGTDADQANHNLLLSAKAEIDAKPELEIYTDDVKCSHGTTVGQLDDDALFYLRSRGLDKQRATQVLTYAFAAGLVSHIPVENAREAVNALVESRLGELIGSGEDFAP